MTENLFISIKKLFLSELFVLLCCGVNAQNIPYVEKMYGGSDSGIVGAIDGEHSVSPSGQFTYSIPIPIVAGTGGVKPALTIAYNNSTKDGLLGYGFELVGLSMISRTPGTLIDGGISYVNFTSRDKFMLDGMRLVDVGVYAGGGYEYRTENDVFARIVAKGNSTNPESFTVYTKDGLTYEYKPDGGITGTTTGNTLFWLVTKVTDTSGNYYTVNYGGNASTNDFWPTRIIYTGNERAGLNPYASVSFEYADNQTSPVSYVYGHEVRRSRILTDINAAFGTQTVKVFHLDYQNVNGKRQLVRISESADDGTHKNPTTFEWYNLENFSVTDGVYTQTPSIHKAKLTIGDFNGDGKSDFLATPENNDAGWNGWKLFISDGKSFRMVSENVMDGKSTMAQVVAGDFDGDGYDDIVIKNHYGSNYQTILYTTDVSQGKVELKYRKMVLSENRKYTIQSVSYDGDGMADLFVWYDKSKDYKIIRALANNSVAVPLNEIYSGTVNAGENWDRLEYCDLNGDGLTDIMNLHQNGYSLYVSNTGNMDMYSSPVTGTWPDKYHDMRFGDFNGDGKSDMFLTGWEKDPNVDGWANWNICFSKGNNTFERLDFARLFKSKDKQIFVMDINGDGFDDFYAVDRKSDGNNMTSPDVWLNDGTGRVYKQARGANTYALDKWHYYAGDYNGDGKMDLLCTADWKNSTWDGYQLFVMPEGMTNLLSQIKDGMGNVTTVSYKYLSDASVFERGTDYEYPLSSVGSSWPVVSEVSVPDGVGGRAVTSYKYSNALVHRRGRGLLGFESVTINDLTNGTKIVDEYEVNKDKYVMSLKRSRTWSGDRLLADKVVENKVLYTGFAKVFAVVPVSVTEMTYEYNSGAKVSEMKSETEYDMYGNVSMSVTEKGGVTTTTQNVYVNDKEKWRLGRLKESTVTHSKYDETLTKKATFEYDDVTGLLIAENSEPDNAVYGIRKEYVRDVFGNIVESRTIPNNGDATRREKTSYDSRGQYILSKTNTLGFKTQLTVDEALGVELTSIDVNNQLTTNTYDRFGRLLTMTSPLLSSRSCTGWAEGMKDAPSTAVYFTYTEATGSPYSLEFFDCLGRTVRKVSVTPFDEKVYVDTEYNSRGLVVRTSEPYFPGDNIYWNLNYYDDVGRTVRQITADGAETSITYNGNETTVTDALGRNTVKRMDMLGRLVSCQDISGCSISYEYDVAGNCIEVDGPNKTILMEYDIMGRRTRIEDYDIGVVEDEYNAYGECIRHKDGKGTTTYAYDSGGRITLEENSDGKTRYFYDSGWKGSISSIYGYEAIKTFYYDEYGRVKKVQDYYGEISYYTETTYNDIDKPDVITYPSGLRVKNHYNKYGMLLKVTGADDDRLYWELKATDARMQPVEEMLGNGLTVNTAYDDASGRVESIVTPGISNMQYGWDCVGNLISRTDVGKGLSEDFSYDRVNRLSEVRRNGETVQTMTYDYAGNILTKSDVGRYVYNVGNRLTNIMELLCVLKSWRGMEYTPFHKLSRVKIDNTHNMEFKYGVDKSRIRMARVDVSDSRPIVKERRYYVGKIYEEEHDSNNNVTCFNYIFAGDKMVAISVMHGKDDVETVFLHHDHLGSVLAYTDSDGRLIQELSYDAWGRRRDPATWNYYDAEASAGAYDVHGFTGHEHIDILEMINMDGRIYDPIVGRFLSPDPIIQNMSFSQSLNRYSYCLNNPLSMLDPTGYSWLSKNWKSLIAATVGIVVGAVTGGAMTGVVAAAIVGGAAGGAAGALTGALLNGANISQIAKATFTGAFWGGVSGFLNFSSGGGELIEKLFKHSLSNAWLEGVKGGNMAHGMLMGLVKCGSSDYVSSLGNKIGPIIDAYKVSVVAMSSGLVSEISGGNFANGAVTGAFAYLFNAKLHEWESDRRSTHDLVFIGKNSRKILNRALKFMIKRYQYTRKEVAALRLDDGHVVVMRDGKSRVDYSELYTDKGAYPATYKGIEVVSYVHTHPTEGLWVNQDNPLNVSYADSSTAQNLGLYDINVLLENGDYYNVGVSVQSWPYPTLRFNVYNE